MGTAARNSVVAILVAPVRAILLFLSLLVAWILEVHFPLRLQLFEWCDQWFVPAPLQHHFQKTLTSQWHRLIPLLQSKPPVDHASELVHQALSNISDINTQSYTVVDFCSGAGGPTPTIERKTNKRRETSGLPPIEFRLSDLYPNLDAWMDLASHSAHLSFIPQPLDARKPCPSAISVSSRPMMTIPLAGQYTDNEVSALGKVAPDKRSHAQREADRERARRELTANTKIVHLFCLAFHHFNDADARGVIASSLRDSDGFIIIELQERTLSSLVMMAGYPLLLLAVSWLWFWPDITHLLITYALPILPFAHGWDGLVSCLRTRTPKEMQSLIESVLVQDRKEKEEALALNALAQGRWASGVNADWTISQTRVRHTWPAGYMTATVGIRSDVRRETQ